MLRRIIQSVIWPLALVFGAAQAWALQTIDVKDQRSHVVKISAKEMTRLAVEGGKIRRLDYVTGELEVKKDPSVGHYLLIPSVTSKPINVFVTTDSGQTHALVLQPTDMPLETVILREAPQKPSLEARQHAGDRAGALDTAVKRLVTAMARGEQPTEYDVKPVNKALALWEGTQFILQQRYVGAAMTGERFLLRNTGSEVMRLSEQELFQPGIIAISIERQILAPGESTEVYVMRVNNDG